MPFISLCERAKPSSRASVSSLGASNSPLRLGEPARVLGMSERCGRPVMQVTASAIAERLLDAVTNVVVLILGLPY